MTLLKNLKVFIITKIICPKLKKKSGENRIFHSECQSIINKSKLADQTQLSIFDHSSIFFLEMLGEGGFGIVQKAYDKNKNDLLR